MKKIVSVLLVLGFIFVGFQVLQVYEERVVEPRTVEPFAVDVSLLDLSNAGEHVSSPHGKYLGSGVSPCGVPFSIFNPYHREGPIMGEVFRP
ncbi:MAG: hypothetical protein FWG63_13000 [Defluviitaleaceae bacterium]|nr:hypothetical protein [Defluviitaleaceae bacterium]